MTEFADRIFSPMPHAFAIRFLAPYMKLHEIQRYLHEVGPALCRPYSGVRDDPIPAGTVARPTLKIDRIHSFDVRCWKFDVR